MNILVLSGGNSNEHHISTKSGNNVAKALRSKGHKVIVDDPSSPDFNLEKYKDKIDLVLPILHGKGGEDGSIQTALEKAGLPYVGTGPKASKLSFDKAKFKQKLVDNQILTPKWEIVDKDSYKRSELSKHPHVIKPISGGSSIDTIIIRNPKNKKEAEATLSKYNQMLLEELINGQEVTVAVLNDKALPLILIVPPEGQEFDFQNKYNGKTKEIAAPSHLSEDLVSQAQNLAEAIHRLAGLRHLSRTDMIIDKDSKLYVLETNTMPGLTENSLYPKAAKAAGMTLTDLVEEFIGLAKSEK